MKSFKFLRSVSFPRLDRKLYFTGSTLTKFPVKNRNTVGVEGGRGHRVHCHLAQGVHGLPKFEENFLESKFRSSSGKFGQ